MATKFDIHSLLPSLPEPVDLRGLDDRSHFEGCMIHEALVTATHWISSNAAGDPVLRAYDGHQVEVGLVFLGLRAEVFEVSLENEIRASRAQLESRSPTGFVSSDVPFGPLRVEGYWRMNTLVEASGRSNQRREMVVARWSRVAGAGGKAPVACGWVPRPA